MLVLRGKEGDTVRITKDGEELVITLKGFSQGRTVLGFEGNRSFQILRTNAKKKGEINPPNIASIPSMEKL